MGADAVEHEEIRAFSVIAIAALTFSVGCGGSSTQSTGTTATVIQSVTSTVTITSRAETSPTTALMPNAPKGSGANRAATPLYETVDVDRSDYSSGRPITATLDDVDYTESTGMWVGCSGAPATAKFALTKRFSRLQAVAGLQYHTPQALTVDVEISGDGRTIERFTLVRDKQMPLDIDVTEVDSLSVAATAQDPDLCGFSTKPYGVLGDALLMGR